MGSKLFKFLKDWDFLLLLVPFVPLVIVCWPIGAWHQWSWTWLAILAIVLISEGISYFWSPEKRSISNVMRKQLKEHPVRFWIVQTLWLAFAGALIFHFAT